MDIAEILTSFRRKVAAIGGMSAQIPIKGDEKANEVAMNKVRADKLREVANGHDGTWIAHPLINKIAREIFDQHMLGSNQVRFRLCALLHAELSLLSVVPRPARGRSCRCC
jgi:malate synthase